MEKKYNETKFLKLRKNKMVNIFFLNKQITSNNLNKMV